MNKDRLIGSVLILIVLFSLVYKSPEQLAIEKEIANIEQQISLLESSRLYDDSFHGLNMGLEAQRAANRELEKALNNLK